MQCRVCGWNGMEARSVLTHWQAKENCIFVVFFRAAFPKFSQKCNDLLPLCPECLRIKISKIIGPKYLRTKLEMQSVLAHFQAKEECIFDVLVRTGFPKI